MKARMTRKQALLVGFLVDAVPAGPGQLHRARRLLRATSAEYVEIIARSGEQVGGVTSISRWCRRRPGRGQQMVWRAG